MNKDEAGSLLSRMERVKYLFDAADVLKRENKIQAESLTRDCLSAYYSKFSRAKRKLGRRLKHIEAVAIVGIDISNREVCENIVDMSRRYCRNYDDFHLYIRKVPVARYAEIMRNFE